MAEKKITKEEDAQKNETQTQKRVAKKKPAEPAVTAEDKKKATRFRIGAVVLWILAIVFEVIAVLLLVGKLEWTFMSTLALIIIALVLDLICVIAGSLLWKKSNLFDPASKQNKVKFWLWNNMGLIVCAFAFIPFVIIALTNKNADKKTKTIATIVAIIALLIGGLFSYDWNPISAEEKQEAIEEYSDDTVYWTTFGRVYHLYEDCSHINNSDSKTDGTVKEAIESNRTRACKTCEKRYEDEFGTADEKTTEDGESDENEDQDTDDQTTDDQGTDETEG